MAYEVCEHCMMSVCRNNAVVREGFSYHRECNKCYVCNETNLLNAEIFKGVIFCSSCSQRIFKGCSTARQTKNTTRPKRTRSRSHNRRRERGHTQDKRSDAKRSKLLRESGVIELARLAHSTDTDSNPDPYKPLTRSSKTLTKELVALNRQHLPDETVKDMKQHSTEMGITTEFTQDLLKQINCPVVEWRNYATSPVKPIKKNLTEDKRNKPICSDLRIAELGTSTEIATMALRKQSEVPVTEKSEIRVKRKKSPNLSLWSDGTACGLEDWIETACSTLHHRSDKQRSFDLSIGNIIKMPFSFFKNNIMTRSSLVSDLMMEQDSGRLTLFDRFKMLFHEEITAHHHRGVKRLYSTINRRKCPYKLGWLHLDTIESENKRYSSSSHQHHSSQSYKCSGCKHFRQSHSYRCLRAHIMKRAGPTKSQLAVFRRKMIDRLSPAILGRLFDFMFLQREAIMMSEACGNSDDRQNESKTFTVVTTLFDRFKMLFHEEITAHHHRGVKRLYSTINRRKCPYKLGWLNLDTIESENKRYSSSSHQHHSSQSYKCSGCKHFRQSHSYRCLRAHIMKRAGPTKSQLAVFRRKTMDRLSPAILGRLFDFMFLQREAIMMSEACGNSDGRQNESKTFTVET